MSHYGALSCLSWQVYEESLAYVVEGDSWGHPQTQRVDQREGEGKG